MSAFRTDRSRLQSFANPNPKIDYISRLNGDAQNGALTVSLFYVPDKLVLLTAAFQEYLADIQITETAALEPVALQVLDDINNEVVPRWVEVKIWARSESKKSTSVIVVDQQPKWTNPSLLARLD
ncbi:MAG: hypothetical protein CMM59_14640 [Rhodospirillaceae bacterium]|nr:hypothetical protein [Rhodospirillaceae bacterium]|tara:strand:+ start:539 stop:913 length:375 start_codon:yes stop_codon:yes gene_type:complete